VIKRVECIESEIVGFYYVVLSINKSFCNISAKYKSAIDDIILTIIKIPFR